MRVFVLGYPHPVGGAGGHCWANVRLWRSLGIDVAMLPWCEVRGNSWTARLDGIGVPTLPDESAAVVKRGDVVISYCNPKFFEHAPALKKRRARLIWVGCMSYVHSCEESYYRTFGPCDYVVVNSKFQEATIRPELEKYYDPDHVVRVPSCFWADEWRFCPRERGERFYIGRLSRSSKDKFSSSTWRIYEKVRKAVGENSALRRRGSRCFRPRPRLPKRSFTRCMRWCIVTGEQKKTGRECAWRRWPAAPWWLVKTSSAGRN